MNKNLYTLLVIYIHPCHVMYQWYIGEDHELNYFVSLPKNSLRGEIWICTSQRGVCMTKVKDLKIVCGPKKDGPLRPQARKQRRRGE